MGSAPSVSMWLHGVLGLGTLAASVNNRDMSPASQLRNKLVGLDPGTMNAGGWYRVSLIAFCLRHSQVKGLKKGKGKSTAESL